MAEHEQDPGARADELEKETDELQKHSQELAEEISDVRTDWESKRSDPGVPGAMEPSDAERAGFGRDDDTAQERRTSPRTKTSPRAPTAPNGGRRGRR